uniref:G-protein coupled receptors family 1 profile domain-containing protein n=1 Tax=Mastacembelus armatus TaxID=205130 RepID=A0A3Q3MRJ6_9TELE
MVPTVKAATISNVTFVRPAKFYFSGYSNIPYITYFLIFMCFVYIMTVVGNVFLMSVIYLVRTLHTPKYMIVFNLALADLCGSSASIPKVLDAFLFDRSEIVYEDCLSSMFFFYFFTDVQSWILVIMAYDRFIAICFPLRYHSIVTKPITHRFMFSLIASFWLFAITVTLTAAGLLTRLSFCKSVIIDSYFCDHGQIYRLACNDSTPSYVIGKLLPVLILWLPLIFILFTYLYIGYALTKVATVHERVKALKTCTAHLSLVAIYFLPIIITFVYMGNIHPNVRIINLSLTSVFPPMLNPIIYVLQTEEIKKSVKKLFKVKLHTKIPIEK